MHIGGIYTELFNGIVKLLLLLCIPTSDNTYRDQGANQARAYVQ